MGTKMKLLRGATSLFALLAMSSLAFGQAKATKPKAKPEPVKAAEPAQAYQEPAAAKSTVYGHVWGAYTEDDMSVSEGVLGLSRAFDATFSGNISYYSDGAKTGLYSANVKAANLLGKDSFTAGLQPQTYIGLVDVSLGTKWLGASLLEAAGFLPARDAGFTYRMDYAPFMFAAHIRNDKPKDKRQTYGLLYGVDVADWLNATLEVEHSALTDEQLYNLALLAKTGDLSAALEFAHKNYKEDEIEDFAGFGLTANYQISGTKFSVYGQFLSGDEEFKKAKFKHTVAFGPTMALNDYIKAALLFQSVEKETGKDGKEDREDGVVLKGAVSI